MAAALADRLGERFLGVREFLHQPAIAFRLLERGEVLALDVFDESDFEGGAVVELLDDDRDLVELRQLRGAPAPLAGDDLIAVRGTADRAYEQRLKDAFRADRVGQGAQRVVVEAMARLKPSGAQETDRHGLAGGLAIGGVIIPVGFTAQRGKSAAEIAPLALFAHRIAPLDRAPANVYRHARRACSRRSTSLARWM